MTVKQLPLYQRIANDIQDQIKSNSFVYDEPICTEKSLCEKYHVSRITAKHAITKLEGQGILYRKRGQGSFVSKPIIQGAPKRTFALLIPFKTTVGGAFWMVEAVNQVFGKLGHHLTTHLCKINPADNVELLEGLFNKHMDGIVYYPTDSSLPLDALDAFVQHNKPVIILDKPTTHSQFTSILCDNYRGGYLLAEHLLSYGHSRMCFLSRSKPEELPNVWDRYKGYEDCLAASGVNAKPRFAHWDTTGEEQTRYYLLQHLVNTLHQEGVTAILCENDIAAFNVHMCCQNLGLRVPEDMNITGFDNNEWATTGNAQITTVDQNFAIIGSTVAKVLLEEDYKPRNHIIPVSFIPRKSTGKAFR